MTVPNAETPRRTVGEPVQPLRIVCRRSGSVPWEGGQPVTDDPQQLLADFADVSCPIGGTAFGCPSTTAAQAATRRADPQTRLGDLEAAAPQTGTVTGVTGNRVVVSVAGEAKSLPRLAGYAPNVGDTVQITGPASRRVVAGKIT